FPTWFSMAMDYVPIQGSATCEWIFSSSTETDMKKCSHIKPVLMESLQMLKYFYKKSCLAFSSGLVLQEEDL
ncbi:hypothetical protein PAXRUDRAFT_46524, partial [Paxillus rubicundulus Ve08.2h10]